MILQHTASSLTLKHVKFFTTIGLIVASALGLWFGAQSAFQTLNSVGFFTLIKTTIVHLTIATWAGLLLITPVLVARKCNLLSHKILEAHPHLANNPYGLQLAKAHNTPLVLAVIIGVAVNALPIFFLAPEISSPENSSFFSTLVYLLESAFASFTVAGITSVVIFALFQPLFYLITKEMVSSYNPNLNIPLLAAIKWMKEDIIHAKDKISGNTVTLFCDDNTISEINNQLQPGHHLFDKLTKHAAFFYYNLPIHNVHENKSWEDYDIFIHHSIRLPLIKDANLQNTTFTNNYFREIAFALKTKKAPTYRFRLEDNGFGDVIQCYRHHTPLDTNVWVKIYEGRTQFLLS